LTAPSSGVTTPHSRNAGAQMIDRYIHFYNHERIQSKTVVPPLSLRHSC